MKQTALVYRKAPQFFAGESGNFAVIFALLAMPVLALTGLGLDYARMLKAEQQLQASLDAAVTAAATTPGTTAAIQHAVQDFLGANLEAADIDLKTQVDTYTITAIAEQEVPMAVLPALGMPTATITATTELTSRTPIRQSGAGLSPGDRRLRAAIEDYKRLISKMPPRRQAEWRAWMRRQEQKLSTPAPFHISR